MKSSTGVQSAANPSVLMSGRLKWGRAMTQARFDAHVRHYIEAQGKFERAMLSLTENVAILEETCRQLTQRIAFLEKATRARNDSCP